jgi:hypothetical protein
VSLASGRMPNSFEAVANLVREAAAFPLLRVLLVCRKFDVDNDYRIRGLSSRSDETVSVGKLSHRQVNQAVDHMNLDSRVLTDSQRSLLANPLNLALLSEIAQDPNALSFASAGALFDLYWNRKRRDVSTRRPDVRFDEAVYAIAADMSRRQRLSVPKPVDDRDTRAAYDVLLSEHILVQDSREIAFFHEGVFDYAFSRYWVSLGRPLIDFLLESEQELFRRAQVRQVLSFLRGYDQARFVSEIDSVLRSRLIRYHVKQIVFAVLGQLSNPTASEARAVTAIADAHPEFETRLWAELQTGEWLKRLSVEGYINQWLSSSDEKLQSRAVRIMARASNDSPVAVAELLSQYGSDNHYASWLLQVAFTANIESTKPLFELLLNAVRAGLYARDGQQFEFACYRLAQTRSPWSIELLKAHFVERHGAMDLDEDGRVEALVTSNHGLAKLIRGAAEAQPREFCETFLPYMRQVIVATAEEDSDGFGWPGDRHFSDRYDEDDQSNEGGQVFLTSMVGAIRTLAVTDAASLTELVHGLAEDRYDATQLLLYQAIIAGGSTYADWAAELLLEVPQRLFCGYQQNSVWVTRLLLQSIGGSISDAAYEQIERSVRDLRFPWEMRRPGWYAFNLLSALREDRLSQVGYRRLGEYRRRFETDQPPPPTGVISGWIGPPIPGEAVEHMTDRNWLQAIHKHREDRTDWTRFTGGARELSTLLQQETAKDPGRFARLALGLNSESHAAYGSAILRGFAEGPAAVDPEPVFEAIRHIADLGEPEQDRWIGPSLARYNAIAPIDLVERVLNRALNAGDPADDRSIFGPSSDRSAREQLHMTGMNSVRGANALSLGDLVFGDTGGARTELVVPYLDRLAGDPVLSVRDCVANVLAATFRRARAQSVAAFWQLIQPRGHVASQLSRRNRVLRALKRPLRMAIDLANRSRTERSRHYVDDLLLTSNYVHQVLFLVGSDDAALARPVIHRMLTSDNPEVWTAGGRMSAFAGLEWGYADLLRTAATSRRPATRVGVAEVVSQRITSTASRDAATAALERLFNDPAHEVRAAAAAVAARLRGSPLRPYTHLLSSLIASQAFADAVPQLFITLQYAPDRIDDLVLAAAERFLTLSGSEIGDIRSGAAADVHYISELVLRGLVQTDDPTERSALLNIVDTMVRFGADGIEDAIEHSAR